jgi:uncharacterized membrane protein
MNQRILLLVRARHEDESGAILVLSVLFLIVMIIACALAIDLGQQAKDRRDDHKVADLASLDAARALDDQNPCIDSAALASHVTDAATQSAVRNGFAYPASGHTLTVDTGTVDPATGVFTSAPACSSQAVRVTVGSVTNYKFLPGSITQTIRGIGQQKPGAPTQTLDSLFTMGSYLGSLNTSDATLLNGILGRAIKGSSLNTTLVGWQGIQSGSVTLSALQQQLVADGVDVGTPDKFLNNDVTLAKLYTASAEVLTNQGNVAAANAMNALAAQANSSTSVKMGQVLSINQGTPNVLDAQMSVFRLVTGSALVANGSNFISIPDLGVAVPGVSKTAASLQVIEGPVTVPGPKGTFRDTAQIKMTLTSTINKAVTVLGLTTASITGDLPVDVNGGGARGTTQDYNCGPGPSLTAHIDPKAFTTDATGTLHLNGTVPLLGTITAADINVNSPLATTNGTPGNAVFSYPSDFPAVGPPETAGVTKRVGSTTLGLVGMQYSSTGVTLHTGFSDATLAANTAVGVLDPIMGDLDTLIVSRVSRLLGLNIGGADVSPNKLWCNGQIGAVGLPIPVLVG